MNKNKQYNNNKINKNFSPNTKYNIQDSTYITKSSINIEKFNYTIINNKKKSNSLTEVDINSTKRKNLQIIFDFELQRSYDKKIFYNSFKTNPSKFNNISRIISNNYSMQVNSKEIISNSKTKNLSNISNFNKFKISYTMSSVTKQQNYNKNIFKSFKLSNKNLLSKNSMIKLKKTDFMNDLNISTRKYNDSNLNINSNKNIIKEDDTNLSIKNCCNSSIIISNIKDNNFLDLETKVNKSKLNVGRLYFDNKKPENIFEYTLVDNLYKYEFDSYYFSVHNSFQKLNKTINDYCTNNNGENLNIIYAKKFNYLKKELIIFKNKKSINLVKLINIDKCIFYGLNFNDKDLYNVYYLYEIFKFVSTYSTDISKYIRLIQTLNIKLVYLNTLKSNEIFVYNDLKNKNNILIEDCANLYFNKLIISSLLKLENDIYDKVCLKFYFNFLNLKQSNNSSFLLFLENDIINLDDFYNISNCIISDFYNCNYLHKFVEGCTSLYLKNIDKYKIIFKIILHIITVYCIDLNKNNVSINNNMNNILIPIVLKEECYLLIYNICNNQISYYCISYKHKNNKFHIYDDNKNFIPMYYSNITEKGKN